MPPTRTADVTGIDSVTFGALVLPNESWDDLVARWGRLEAAAVDSIWSCDHFTNPHQPGQPWFEGWTSLAGLAAATTRVRIGLLVGGVVSRPPTLFAKEAQTVDHQSGGRLEIGLGAGGASSDQDMWGVEAWGPRERVERFAEYVELVDHLARQDETSFDGRWYRTTGALMAPGFVQRPRPPLLLAAHGPRTLAVAARFADTWNTFGPTLTEGIDQSRLLDEACAAVDRDPARIRRSVLLGLAGGTAWATPSEFHDRVLEWHEAGFRDFFFYDPPYARAGVSCAPPAAVDEILSVTLPRLRAELAVVSEERRASQ